MSENQSKEAREEAWKVINNWKSKNNWERETCCKVHSHGEGYLANYISDALHKRDSEIARLEAVETVLRRNLENAYKEAQRIYPEFDWTGFTKTSEIIVMALHDKIKMQREEIQQKDAEIARLKEGLENYGVHDQSCICSQWRQGEPTPDGGYRTLYGYGKDEKWYQKDEFPKCTCGLKELLDSK